MYIRPAQSSDFDAVSNLLRGAELLTDDLDIELNNFVVGVDNNRICGAGGLEQLNDIALLRSVVVAKNMRGENMGSKIVLVLLDNAKRLHLRHLYLLTTSADRFFGRHGFAEMDRKDAPPSITNTSQFSDLCPASATLMGLSLE